MCKEHLNPGGVVSLWIPLYESNEETSKSLIATFFKVFPNGILWSNDSKAEGYDAILFGQVEPTVVNVDELEKRLKRKDHEAVVKSLRQVNFGSVRVVGSLNGLEANGVAVDLLATFAGKATQLEKWSADAKINTDRNLRLQYLAGMWLNTYEQTQILGSILKYYRFPEDTFVGSTVNLELLRHALDENGRKEPSRRTHKP